MYQKDAWQLLFLFSSRKGKDVQSMNKKKSIWSGVSVLIAAVLAIVAFVRSDTQIWLLTAAFTIGRFGSRPHSYSLIYRNRKTKSGAPPAEQPMTYSARVFAHCLWKRRMASAHCCSAMLTTGSPHI